MALPGSPSSRMQSTCSRKCLGGELPQPLLLSPSYFFWPLGIRHGQLRERKSTYAVCVNHRQFSGKMFDNLLNVRDNGPALGRVIDRKQNSLKWQYVLAPSFGSLPEGRTLIFQATDLSIPWSSRIVTYPVGSASSFLGARLRPLSCSPRRAPSFDLVSLSALIGVRHFAPSAARLRRTCSSDDGR